MEKKFIVPAVFFLAPLLVWIAFLIVYIKGCWTQSLAPWPEVILCLVVGGLILFSGVRCRLASGPRAGNIVRSGVLTVMAVLTFWKVGIIAACVLLAAAVITIAQGLMGSCPAETE